MRIAVIQTRPGHGKRLFALLHRSGRLVLGAAVFALALSAAAQVGATFETLTVKGAEYRQIKVLSVSAFAITIRHADGLAQIPLRDLPAALQAQFDYDPDRAASAEADLAAEMQQQAAVAQAEAGQAARQRAGQLASGDDTPVGRALAHFGQPVTLAPVDLRGQFRALELATKNQGRRPSCSVFAVLSALEYQNALLASHAEKLSEEYVIWSTRRALGLAAGEKRRVPDTDDSDQRDAGFSLGEVLAAVRAYGVPLQSEMPNTFGVGMENIADP
jgi:hypothetical protein